jgi:hypothetical protein
MNLWKKATLDGQHRARDGTIKDAILMDALKHVHGLPSLELTDTLSPKEIAPLLQIRTVDQISEQARNHSLTSRDVAAQWEKESRAKKRQRKLAIRQSNKQYIIQVDGVKPVKPDGNKEKSKASNAQGVFCSTNRQFRFDD